MKTFTNDDVSSVWQNGFEYRKTATIRAVLMPKPFSVQTREGLLTDCPAGTYLATDGKSLWPIAADFMKESYEPVA